MKKNYNFICTAGNEGEFVGQSKTLTKILVFLGATKSDLVKVEGGYTVFDNYFIKRLQPRLNDH